MFLIGEVLVGVHQVEPPAHRLIAVMEVATGLLTEPAVSCNDITMTTAGGTSIAGFEGMFGASATTRAGYEPGRAWPVLDERHVRAHLHDLRRRLPRPPLAAGSR